MHNNLISLKEYLVAYQEIIAEFGYAPVRNSGRRQVLGWDLEYVCGPALASFIDQLMIRRLNDFIPDNDEPRILDCGANIGFSTLNYKRQFPAADIIAFEPDPQFAPILRRNLERNGAENVEVVEAAVWTENGETNWYCEGIDGSKIVTGHKGGVDNTVVRTVDLADFLCREIDLLKIDIEGAEYDVINHLGGGLQTVKNMSIECHLDQTKIGPFADMLDTLVGAGFNVGINSFGSWRDLIRQAEVLPDYWEQYLVVAAWRGTIPAETSYNPLLPYAGAQQMLGDEKLRSTQAELQSAQAELRSVQAELERCHSSRLVRLARKLSRG